MTSSGELKKRVFLRCGWNGPRGRGSVTKLEAVDDNEKGSSTHGKNRVSGSCKKIEALQKLLEC